MREYASGGGTVRKSRGKWQGVMRFRDVTERDGTTSKGEWQTMTRLFDVKAYPDNDRGKKAAHVAWREWRAELVAAEPERAAAEEAARRAEEAAAHGEPDEGAEITARSTVNDLIDYYLSEALDGIRAGDGLKPVEPSTMAGYRRRAEYIAQTWPSKKPKKKQSKAERERREPKAGNFCLGTIAIGDLTTKDVETFKRRMGAVGGYSGATIRDALNVLTPALEEAVTMGAIPKNPAAGVKKPSQRGRASGRRVNYLPPAERARLLADLDATLSNQTIGAHGRDEGRAALAAKLALRTGMREGEICGLQWRDVDTNKGTIRIRRAIGRGEHGALYVKDTKSSASERTVYPSPDLVADLVARRRAMRDALAAAGVRFTESLYVVGGIDGSYYDPRLLYHAWLRRVERLDLMGTERRPSFHDLRHTFATVAAHEGMPEVDLMTLMGHSSINVTHDYYVGVDTDSARSSMLSVQGAMGGGAEIIDFPATGTEG